MEKIEEKNQIYSQDIYIFPFGYWNNQIVKYTKNNDYVAGDYYILYPIPKNNKIVFIDNFGNINHRYDNFKSFYLNKGSAIFDLCFKEPNFPLFGIYKNKWYPLIIEYEEFNEKFGTHSDIRSLYFSYKNYNNNRNYEYAWDLLRYLEKNYPETYSKMEYRNIKVGQYLEKYLEYIFDIMEKEKTLDVLKRFNNIKKYKFTFSYFAYLISEKTKETLNSLVSFLPDIIKNELSNEINY